MASSEVDQKFLGKLARTVEADNPLLSSMLFKILGLSLNLSQQLVTARKQQRLNPQPQPQSLELIYHIIWLSKEGLVMLEQYVLPMVGNYVELKVLAFKLRASFYHIFVLFYKPVLGISTPPAGSSRATSALPAPLRVDKGKGVARSSDLDPNPYDTDEEEEAAEAAMMEGGPVGPPPGFEPGSLSSSPAMAFLLPASIDYLTTAHGFFKEAVALADELLWGSHTLRVSVKTEYAAFLYECVHDAEGSRRLAKDTIGEVYEATEGIDNDMFHDACELVTVLGRMMKRGLSSRSSNINESSNSKTQQTLTGSVSTTTPRTTALGPPPGSSMPEFI